MRQKLRLIKNARLMPLEGYMHEFKAGVYENEKCLPDSLLYRGSPAELQPPRQRLDGTYVFGGYLFAHYGHFLLESLSRAWAIRQCNAKYPLLFMNPADKVIAFQKNLFNALGLRREIILVKEPLEVENLIYSPPGCELLPETFMTDEQMEALGQLAGPPTVENRKIWLSRSRYKGGGVENEAEIEASLAQAGWQVIHPQTLSLHEQVRLIAGSALVAGFAGTAFFNALLARQVQGRFIVIARNPVGVVGTIPHFLKQKGIRYEDHVFPLEYRSGEAAEKRYHMPDTAPLLNLLRQAKL